MPILLIGSFAVLILATVLWYGGSTNFLREANAAGAYPPAWPVWRWLALNVLSVPVFGLAFAGIYRVQQTWWLIEFPYWLISIIVSAVFFSRILNITIGWRDVLAAALLAVVAYLVSSR